MNEKIEGLSSQSPNQESCLTVVPPVLNVTNSEVSAGENLVFEVSLLNPNNCIPISIDWEISTSEITTDVAQNNIDFDSSLAGTIQMPPGSTQTVIAIPTLNDNKKQGTKYLNLNISNITAGDFINHDTQLTALGSILDVNPACIPDSALENYGGGSGITEDPHLICSLTHFDKLGSTVSDWDKIFKQEAEIDLSTLTANSYKMIGSSVTPFTGQYDGNNHKIKNLTYQLSIPDTTPIGLFQVVESAIFKNMILENFTLKSYGTMGGLIAHVTGVNSELLLNNVKILDSNFDGITNTGLLIGLIDGELTCDECFVENSRIVNGDDIVTLSANSLTSIYNGGMVGFCNICHIQNSQILDTSFYQGYSSRFGGLVGGASDLIVDDLVILNMEVIAQYSEAGSIVGRVERVNIQRALIESLNFNITSFSSSLVGVVTDNMVAQKVSISDSSVMLNGYGGTIVGAADGNIDLNEVSFSGSLSLINGRNGGFIGGQHVGISGKTITIQNSFVNSPTGTLGSNFDTYIGGVIGELRVGNSINVSNSFVSVRLGTTQASRGCIRGASTGTWNITNAYFNNSVCTYGFASPTNGNIAGATARTTAQMQDPTNFLEANNWLPAIWLIELGTLPRLVWEQ